MTELTTSESIKSHKKLLEIQLELKVPKNQLNEWGGYKFRSCEDTLEAVKPILKEKNAMIRFKEVIIMIGNRYYIEATAIFIDLENMYQIDATAYAREDEEQSKKDGSQVTGSTSSYARKYALNSLLCIDDTKDSDHDNKHGKDKETSKQNDKQYENKKENKKTDGFERQKTLKWLTEKQKKSSDIKKFLNDKAKEHNKNSFYNFNDTLLKEIAIELKKKLSNKKADPADECLAMIKYIEKHKEKHKELINETLKRNDEPYINMLDKEPLKELYNLIAGNQYPSEEDEVLGADELN